MLSNLSFLVVTGSVLIKRKGSLMSYISRNIENASCEVTL